MTHLDDRFRRVFICPVCERHKMHTRLYGYRCSNPEHDELVHDIMMRWMMKDQDVTLDGFINGYDEYMQPIVRRIIEGEDI